jgi:alanine-glyoxylate transaminase/serine-glyoxylate transaminase/serine-pyruvate transaminase
MTGTSRHHLRLMIPGPCELNPADLAVLARQTVPHYGDSWAPMFRTLLDDLARLLDAEVAYALPGSGTAGLEIALANLFTAGDRVVVPDTGYFGIRLAEIAQALGLRVELLPQPLDAPIEAAEVEDKLAGADGLLVVHVDSTTGIRQPVAELARRARTAGVTVVVDAIASAGGEDIRLRASGIDAVVTAPQKGLGAPPGLAIVAFDGHGVRRMSTHRPRSWYFDLARWAQARAEDEWEPHPVTMPTAIVGALRAAVTRILDTGVESWVARRRDLATELRRRLRAAGLDLNAPEDCSANLVTVIRCPDPGILARRTANRGIMIGQGLPPLTGAVRIGLLGNTAGRQWVDRVVGALAEES